MEGKMNKRELGKLAKEFIARLQEAEVVLMDEKDLNGYVDDLMLDYPELDLDRSQVDDLKTRVQSKWGEWIEPEFIG